MKNFTTFLLITFLTISAYAADGEPDTTFDGDGKVSTDIGANYDAAFNAAQQADGKIVTVGTTRNTDTDADNLLLARYNTNGALDPTFGTNGTVVITNTTSSSTSFGSASGIAFQTDGKILVSVTGRGNVFRFNADGSRDATFGTNGLLTIPTVGNVTFGFAGDVSVLSSGKILVAGSANTSGSFIQGFALARLNQDGSLDTTFGSGGIAVTTFTTGTAAAGATEISLSANGKIALGGSVNPQTTPGQPGIAVYNADGSPDAGFGTNGRVLVAGTSVNFFGSIAWQTDGKIVIVGRRLRSGDTSPAPYFQRYTASGAVDTSFGTNGEVFPILTNRPLINLNDVVIQPDGKILGFGSGFVSFQGNLSAWLTVVRLSPSGALDSTFGTNGIVTTPFNTNFSGNQSQALTGFLQTDGKIVAAGAETVINPTTGTANVNIAIARYSNTAGNPTVNNPTLRYADFDGDGKTDVSTFRSSNSTWYINPSSNPSLSENIAPSGFYGVQFGISTDITVPADYDGDGKSDIAVFRGNPGNPDRSIFYILNSSNGTVRVEQFGRSGDNPTISGDWDGDGKADLAVFRPGVSGGQSYFFYRPSSQSGSDFVTLYWGIAGDTPIFGDFDGDRKLDATVYRPGENAYYVRRSSDGTMLRQQWGIATDDAITAGDFDGDGKSDFAVYRFIGNEAGVWYILQSGATPAVRTVRWGLGSDFPVPADYDGDGKTDFAVFRRSDRVWYIQNSASGTNSYVNFGLSNDFPLPLNLVR